MSENFLLDPLPRYSLLDPQRRIDRLRDATPQILSTIEGETDLIAVQATLACLLYQVFAQANWCGFYRRVSEQELVVGPYQGSLGCLRIALARGVCGRAATTQQIQVIDDVTTFVGHIACDESSRSELVVPVVVGTRTEAVLDIDSPHLAAFSVAEGECLSDLLHSIWKKLI